MIERAYLRHCLQKSTLLYEIVDGCLEQVDIVLLVSHLPLEVPLVLSEGGHAVIQCMQLMSKVLLRV